MKYYMMIHTYMYSVKIDGNVFLILKLCSIFTNENTIQYKILFSCNIKNHCKFYNDQTTEGAMNAIFNFCVFFCIIH